MIKNNCLFLSPNLAGVDQHKPKEVVFLLIESKHLGRSFLLYIDFERSTPSALMKLYLPKCAISLTICAAALVPSNKIAFATCPPNTQPLFTLPETLAETYQPPDYEGDKVRLRRIRFAPSGGAFQRPTVLMLPPDVFWLDYGEHGVTKQRAATYDLQQAGFLVFQVNHRLAPPHYLDGQDENTGWAPDQTDDIKRQILAALPIHAAMAAFI